MLSSVFFFFFNLCQCAKSHIHSCSLLSAYADRIFVCLKASKAVYFLSCFNNAYNLHYSFHTYIEYILIKLTYYYLFLFPYYSC